MFYRIKNKELYDYSDNQYADDCLITDIITQSQLDKDRRQVIVEEYEEEIPPIEEGEEPIIVTKYRLALNPDYGTIELEKAKVAKVEENDKARDAAINGGVVYQDILFDSDTDQKVNLLATVSAMKDTDSIVWYGMNNDSLECTKADLYAIGGLITELHSFCWNKNVYIKGEIAEATTLKAVEAIEISYEWEA